MTTDEFLDKHRNDKCEFYNSNKHSFTYLDLNGRFRIYGLSEYRGEFNKVMTVIELWEEMEEFNFELNDK